MMLGWMRVAIALSKPTLSLLLPLLGCQPAPPEVMEGGEASSGPASSSTSAGPTTSPSDGSTTTAGTGGGTTTGSSTSVADTTSDTGSGDSSTGEPTDEPLGPFATPVAVGELNTAFSEDDPTLTGDLLEIYFASNRGGSEDVWTSTRPSVGAAWAPPMPVASVNSVFTETFPEVSADGLVLLLASDRVIPTDLDVYYSQRSDRGQPWPEPVVLAGASSVGIIDYGATPVADLGRVFLCLDVAGGLGQADIYEAPADLMGGMVGAAVHVPELSTVFADCSVSVSPSGREIFFESTRPIGIGYDWNLWVATRDDAGGPWGEPVAVEELEGESDEVDPWLSPDRRTLWYAGGNLGFYDLYVATRE